MWRTFEYRLYPNRRQRELLMSCLIESRFLYNEMLAVVKDHYGQTGQFLFKYDLMSRFKGRGGSHVPASTVQTVADRLDKALKHFLARREHGKKVGFPRFKGPNRWHSITLRQWGRDASFKDGRLAVPKKLGSSLKLKLHRPFEGKPKRANLTLRADGKWYVLIVCDLGEPPTHGDGPAVGLDVGLKVFLADSNGTTVENPRYHVRSRKRLRRKQRALCRKNAGSKRRKKAARSVAKVHLKVARQRKDFLHKVARRYVDRYATITVEQLNVAGMAKNRHLASAIHDASWSKFVDILEGKAESAGSRVVKVSAHFTTQRCSNCRQLVPKSLSVRTHLCASCGHVENRDVNAAKNILLAWTGPSELNVTGCRERAPRSRLP
jgi:putative transposase